MTAQGIAAAKPPRREGRLGPQGQKPGPATQDAPEPLDLPRHWIAPDNDKYGIGARLIARKQARLNGVVLVTAHTRRRA